MEKKTYTSIGLMSGTSLDGLDLCAVTFDVQAPQNFKILAAKTIHYQSFWAKKLGEAQHLSGIDLMQLNHDFGLFCGKAVADFVQDNKLIVDGIASHGHTIFHSPSTGFTTQIGSGAAICAETGIQTICDFRSLDVAFGGQGAPLVPIGDLWLFADYQACLNLGGIANISLKNNAGIEAQDLGYCNLLLNYWVQKHFACSYDKGGELGKNGKIIPSLLQKMLEFTNQMQNKSLAREDFENFCKILDNQQDKTDVLHTSYHYIAQYLSQYLNTHKVKDVLLTGGGTHNSFLIELIQSKIQSKIIVPSSEIIDFKEALIFAYLGFLRVHGKVNSLQSVTGAKKDVVGGSIWG